MPQEVLDVFEWILYWPSHFFSILSEDTDDFFLLYPFLIGLACFVVYEILKIILKSVYR